MKDMASARRVRTRNADRWARTGHSQGLKRFVISALALVAVVWAVPSAQAQGSRGDAMQQARGFMSKFQSGMNSKNPDTAARFYTSDAVLVTPTGQVFSGPNGAKEYYVDAFKQLGKFTFEGTVEQARIDGPALWFIGKGTIKLSNGSGPPELHTHFAYVLVRQNQEWKAQLVSVGPDAPAPPNAPPANR
jgi:ketosteroid isomerase-like protein